MSETASDTGQEFYDCTAATGVPAAGPTLRRQSRLPPTNVDALLIWPRGGNTGDTLITDACERYLRDRGISTWRSDGSIEDAALADDADYLGDLFATFRGMVMFRGGGNVGIYPDNGMIRTAVIGHTGARHRCLVFPQSAVQAERALINERVTVWCRDATSQAILSKSGTRTELVPDIALYMDDLIPKAPCGKGAFSIMRTPGCDAERIDHDVTLDCASADLTLAHPLDHVIATLNPFELVITDRLHGGLIALMMRKKVILMPVGYHKIKAFHATWLANEPGVAFAETQRQLLEQSNNLRFPTTDFAALFSRYADPAFERFLFSA
jgi:exopolysaccharide biosynthesis predicted pyruvyltransferase EpsI